MSSVTLDKPIHESEFQNQLTYQKVLKFGGKSLDNDSIDVVIEKIKNQSTKVIVVVSARGNATDELLQIIQQALEAKDFSELFESFKRGQQHISSVDLSPEWQELQKLFEGVALLNECSPKTKDKILAYGELIAAKYVAFELNRVGVESVAVDAGEFLVTNSEFGNARLQHTISESRTQEFFQNLPHNAIPVVTGFIARNSLGERTTLGRNGSNYSAALLANYLNAEVVENYTHVNGIFTANPHELQEARQISELSYQEAAELAQFGATILHAKTLEPLIQKNIPLKILNTFGAEDQPGTLVSGTPVSRRVRAISSLSHKSLIRFEGKGLLGKVGVDAKIFNTLQKAEISVGMISQGSSERAIALVIDEADADKAVDSLNAAFEADILKGDVDSIYAEKNLAVLAIIGLTLQNFDKAYKALIQNKITPVLFNNTVDAHTICLLLKQEDIHKAKHVIHGELFERPKRIHLAVIGHGTVGKTFINQVIQQRNEIIDRKNLDLRIFAVANSTRTLLQSQGIDENWESAKAEVAENPYNPAQIIDFAREHCLENLILVDNTANQSIAETYPLFIENGFDVVSSNKIANTLSLQNYKELRQTLKFHNKRYAYETNVGAGLPLIDTIRLLHLSGENITRIKGVFSGSLSYIFNRFSDTDVPFSQVLLEAVEKGYTEPDPREDLNGNDVGRKLLILARELDFEKEMSDVKIDSLIPEGLREISKNQFFENITQLDHPFAQVKEACPENHVLRYTGDLQWDLETQKGTLEVKLDTIPKDSPLGQVKGADSIFEIYTDSYGHHPLVIQGAGAGAEVTARGVFGDVLKLSEAN